MLDGDWQRSCPKDDQSNPVDTGENQDRVVLSKVLIGNDGTENGRDVAEELEEGVETRGTGVAETKATRPIASVRVVANVVLEQTLAAVVYSTS